MALINRPMYEHFGARHLGVKGWGALTNLEEGVMGVLPLDMSADPAYWFIQGIRAFGQDKYVAAGGAGTYAKVGLALEEQDPESPCIVKILSWVIAYPTANINMKRVARTAFSSDPGEYGVAMDTRIPEAQPSQAVIISSNDNLVPGTQFASYDDVLNPTLTTHQVPMIISPGQAIYCMTETANTAMKMTITWAEIPAYQAEL